MAGLVKFAAFLVFFLVCVCAHALAEGPHNSATAASSSSRKLKNWLPTIDFDVNESEGPSPSPAPSAQPVPVPINDQAPNPPVSWSFPSAPISQRPPQQNYDMWDYVRANNYAGRNYRRRYRGGYGGNGGYGAGGGGRGGHIGRARRG